MMALSPCGSGAESCGLDMKWPGGLIRWKVWSSAGVTVGRQSLAGGSESLGSRFGVHSSPTLLLTLLSD